MPDGGYMGFAYWMTKVTIKKLPVKTFNWALYVERKSYDDDGNPAFEMLHEAAYRTLGDALAKVAEVGNMMVTTTNILNPEAGELEIRLAEKGGCTDPGTELYHCM
jgi:hypothetical protein